MFNSNLVKCEVGTLFEIDNFSDKSDTETELFNKNEHYTSESESTCESVSSQVFTDTFDCQIKNSGLLYRSDSTALDNSEFLSNLDSINFVPLEHISLDIFNTKDDVFLKPARETSQEQLGCIDFTDKNVVRTQSYPFIQNIQNDTNLHKSFSTDNLHTVHIKAYNNYPLIHDCMWSSTVDIKSSNVAIKNLMGIDEEPGRMPIKNYELALKNVFYRHVIQFEHSEIESSDDEIDIANNYFEINFDSIFSSKKYQNRNQYKKNIYRRRRRRRSSGTSEFNYKYRKFSNAKQDDYDFNIEQTESESDQSTTMPSNQFKTHSNTLKINSSYDTPPPSPKEKKNRCHCPENFKQNCLSAKINYGLLKAHVAEIHNYNIPFSYQKANYKSTPNKNFYHGFSNSDTSNSDEDVEISNWKNDQTEYRPSPKHDSHSFYKRQHYVYKNEKTGGKRSQHNDLERKRRNDLKTNFEILRDLVPVMKNRNRRAKVTILQDAIEYIDILVKEEKNTKCHLEKLKGKHLLLKRSYNNMNKSKKIANY